MRVTKFTTLFFDALVIMNPNDPLSLNSLEFEVLDMRVEGYIEINRETGEGDLIYPCSLDRIAKKLGISKQAVSQHQKRALAKLWAIYQRRNNV